MADVAASSKQMFWVGMIIIMISREARARARYCYCLSVTEARDCFGDRQICSFIEGVSDLYRSLRNCALLRRIDRFNVRSNWLDCAQKPITLGAGRRKAGLPNKPPHTRYKLSRPGICQARPNQIDRSTREVQCLRSRFLLEKQR